MIPDLRKLPSQNDPYVRPPARRSLGQNFLVHKGTLETIVRLCRIAPEDRVIELGVGLGALTRELAKAASRVIGIEIDRRLISWLSENGRMPANVEIRACDMLDASFADLAEELGGPVKVVGNLPYNISSQIVFRLLKERRHIDWAVLMFQKEVALRLLSRSGSRDYGILSVVTGYCADLKRLMDVPPGLFRPRPKVVSTLVRLDFRPPVSAARDFDFFVETVRKAFQQRRKKLANALKGFAGLKQNDLAHAIDVCGVDGTSRAEDLNIEQFVSLSNILYVLNGYSAESCPKDPLLAEVNMVK
jgi:16S rRNA (adenine1518-N6/adenine1519-N6)-dimethyltransferase